MTTSEMWSPYADAIEFAVSCILDDPDPRNERETADGLQYVMRVLTAVGDSSMLLIDPQRPTLLDMLPSVRFLGGSGPDIDYDVAILLPGELYRISGGRGEASFVGITVYAGEGEGGAVGIAASVDVDDIVEPDGSFSYEFQRPDAVRVVVRQYFHDRSEQSEGEWVIERLDAPADLGPSSVTLPTIESMERRVANAAASIRWNAQLNRLWTPQRRLDPNTFVRRTAEEIVAAVPNPDVVYSFTWWKMDDDEVLLVDFTPPATRYWSLQMCDRWFQCYPDRRSNLHDQQCVPNPDGSVTIVLSDGDPGVPNWLDTSGHRVGTMFFRWLHADFAEQPTVRVAKRSGFRS